MSKPLTDTCTLAIFIHAYAVPTSVDSLSDSESNSSIPCINLCVCI